MVVESAEQARAVLEEVGAFQRAVDSGSMQPDKVAGDMIGRVEGLIEWYMASGASGASVYSNLVENLGEWSMGLVVRAGFDHETPEYRAFQMIGEFVERYGHLQPERREGT